MLTLLSPAKTFASASKLPQIPTELSEPLLIKQSRPIVSEALSMKAEELGRALHISPKLALEAHRHWQNFVDPSISGAAAALMYSGMVFRKLGAKTFDREQWEYACECLRFTSFVYGLLRPNDEIKPYRMEGNVWLERERKSVFEYWRDDLTRMLIDEVQQRGGVLCFLASEEMKQLFHWRAVEEAVQVISPTFLTRQPDGSTKQIVIYTKMARGLMARSIILSRIEDPEALRHLSPEGFLYSPDHSSQSELVYLMD